MRVRNHILQSDDGDPVAFRATPNLSTGKIQPLYLVMHYTAGASAQSSIDWLTNPDAQASAHLVIARDGTVTQLAGFNRRTWHAGRSQWDGLNNLNSHSIGIELDNPGLLQGRDGRWLTGWSRPVADEDVIVAPHANDGIERGWHAYTETQLVAAANVAVALVRHYDLRDVVGHDQIAPDRKQDPGPAFPMESFRASVMGREWEAPDEYVTSTTLNIRTGPGTGQEKLPQGPLKPGTRLEALASQGVWRKVQVLDEIGGDEGVIGWVHGNYIRLA